MASDRCPLIVGNSRQFALKYCPAILSEMGDFSRIIVRLLALAKDGVPSSALRYPDCSSIAAGLVLNRGAAQKLAEAAVSVRQAQSADWGQW